MLKVGDKVRLIYDARPLKRKTDHGYGEIIKITPTGLLRIMGMTGIENDGRDELFNPYTGYAKGWNTLRFEEIDEDESITVCDQCFMTTCWQGIFMCDKSRNAGTVERSRKELRVLNKEHESYWEKERMAK